MSWPTWRIILADGSCHASIRKPDPESALLAFHKAGMTPMGVSWHLERVDE